MICDKEAPKTILCKYLPSNAHARGLEGALFSITGPLWYICYDKEEKRHNKHLSFY